MEHHFVGGYGHNIVAIPEQENLNATIAVVVVAGRALILVGRYLIWHAWDKGEKKYVKIEEAEEIEMTDEEVAAIKARQPQPQALPQPSIALATPSNSKVKVGEDGRMQIYSQTPKRTPDLLEKFEEAAENLVDNAEDEKGRGRDR